MSRKAKNANSLKTVLEVENLKEVKASEVVEIPAEKKAAEVVQLDSIEAEDGTILYRLQSLIETIEAREIPPTHIQSNRLGYHSIELNINDRIYQVYEIDGNNSSACRYAIPLTMECTKPIDTLENFFNDTDLLKGTKYSKKYYDLKTVNGFSSKDAMPAAARKVYDVLILRQREFKTMSNYIVQLNNVINSTGLIDFNKESRFFTEDELFTYQSIARVLKYLANKNSLYLGIVATRKQKGFNIVKIADSVQGFYDFYEIPHSEKKAKKALKVAEAAAEKKAAEAEAPTAAAEAPTAEAAEVEAPTAEAEAAEAKKAAAAAEKKAAEAEAAATTAEEKLRQLEILCSIVTNNIDSILNSKDSEKNKAQKIRKQTRRLPSVNITAKVTD